MERQERFPELKPHGSIPHGNLDFNRIFQCGILPNIEKEVAPMSDKRLISANGVPYNVALAADRLVADVRRLVPQRGVVETWKITGQADFVVMLTHYQINDADAIARDFFSPIQQ